jgi:hypothetical protein
MALQTNTELVSSDWMEYATMALGEDSVAQGRRNGIVSL